MSKELRLGLVGAGAISQAYIQAAREVQGIRWVGVADLRPAAAAATAELAGCPAFTDAESLARTARPNAVLVCTPPNTHEAVTLELLDSGISVLCEKPLTLDSASAERMLAAAERSRGLLTMASKFRYCEDIVRAKSLIEAGTIGPIVLFENTFAARVDMSRRWNSDPRISGGGVLIDNGTHSVDVYRYLLGPIASVHAVEGIRTQDLMVEDTVHVFARSHRGTLASIDLSWTIQKPLDSYLDLYGTAGTLRVGWKSSRYQLASSPDWIEFGTGYDKLAAFRAQLEDFRDAVHGGTPRVTLQEALSSVLVVEAAYRSLAADAWVPVEEDLSAGERP